MPNSIERHRSNKPLRPPVGAQPRLTIILPYKLDTTNGLLTSRAGLLAIIQLMDSLSLAERIGQHFPLADSNRGFPPFRKPSSWCSTKAAFIRPHAVRFFSLLGKLPARGKEYIGKDLCIIPVLYSKSISNLAVGDFAGLSMLQRLTLNGNQLTTLPDDGETLAFFKQGLTLEANNFIDLTPEPVTLSPAEVGNWELFIGYQLADGKLLYHRQPLRIEVME